MCRDPILQKDTQEAGPLCLFTGCPLNDFTLGPTFQRSIASNHYTEDQGLPTRAPPGGNKRELFEESCYLLCKGTQWGRPPHRYELRRSCGCHFRLKDFQHKDDLVAFVA